MNEKIYDNFEDELDAIRLELYEEIKDMTPEALENFPSTFIIFSFSA